MKSYYSLILLSLLLLSLINSSVVVHAQQPCQIICDKEMPVCSQEPVTLSVPDNDLYRFRWTPGNYTTNSITEKPIETTTYHVYVTDTAGFEICENSFTIEVKPRFQTTMRQLKLTCGNSEAENGQTAQVKVDVTGVGAPYTYYWEERVYNRWEELGPMHYAPNDPSIAIGLKAYTYYRVEITDSRGCVQFDSIYTRGFPTPDVVISCFPGDTVIMQNSEATFSFENLSADSIPMDNFYWILPDGQTSVNPIPTYVFTEPNDYTVSLTIYDDFGCDTSYFKTIKVVPYGLNENSLFSVDISPNPTNGNVIIKTDNHFQISIFNAYGQLICEDSSDGNCYGYDFGKYCDGIYLLKIKTSTGMVIKRVVVAK